MLRDESRFGGNAINRSDAFDIWTRPFVLANSFLLCLLIFYRADLDRPNGRLITGDRLMRANVRVCPHRERCINPRWKNEYARGNLAEEAT